MSEVDTCRERLEKFCIGNGVDLGFGGCEPIVPNAICIDREVGHPHRAKYGDYQYPTHLVGDVRNLHWFSNEVLDFVFSSHVLEDFEDTKMVLTEWFRVLKAGGNMVLFLPDQPTYEKCCKEANALPNQAHKHKDFSLEYVLQCTDSMGVGRSNIIHSLWPVPNNAYSFDLVLRKPYTPLTHPLK